MPQLAIEKCKGKTHDRRYPYPESKCWNKVWKDGYCKIHHPEEKLRKQRERNAKKDKLFEASQKQSEEPPEQWKEEDCMKQFEKDWHNTNEKTFRLIPRWIKFNVISPLQSKIEELKMENGRINQIEKSAYACSKENANLQSKIIRLEAGVVDSVLPTLKEMISEKIKNLESKISSLQEENIKLREEIERLKK